MTEPGPGTMGLATINFNWTPWYNPEDLSRPLNSKSGEMPFNTQVTVIHPERSHQSLTFPK